MTDPIIIWQMQPVWNMPNASPFCMKVEAFCNLAGIAYETRGLTRPPRSKTKKIPYVERKDGSLLHDSSQIIKTLTAELELELDAHLSPQQRAESVMMQRTWEEHFYFVVLAERWLDDDNWPSVRDAYFSDIPGVLRRVIAGFIRRGVVKSCHGQGLGRLSPKERLARAKSDLEAFALPLEQRQFLLGNRPSSIDATGVAFLANLYEPPLNSDLRRVAESLPALRRYYDEICPLAFPNGKRSGDAVEYAPSRG